MSRKPMLSLATFLVVFSFMCGTRTVDAADADGQFAVRGIGGQTCSSFITVIENADPAQREQGILSFINWTAGYLSYVNRSSQGVFDASPIIESRDLLQVILNQCGQNLDALFENVAFDVLSVLSKGAVIKASPLVSVNLENQSRQYREETIISVQNALIEKELLEGPPDGVVGPATQAAIARFQKDQGLTATGFLDFATVIRALIR